MSKLRLLTIFSIGLLIANILLVGFILTKKNGKRNHHKRPNPVEMFTKKIHFNDTQKAQLEILVAEQRSYMDSVRNIIKPLKEALRKDITAPDISFENERIFNELGLIQADVERKFHQHFIDIRSLCAGDQTVRFDNFLESMPHRNGPHRNRRK